VLLVVGLVPKVVLLELAVQVLAVMEQTTPVVLLPER
jgi:hypothetical protein